MRFGVLLLVSSFFPALGQNRPPTAETHGGVSAEQLAGAWRLVSIETVRANGEIIYPFYGKQPRGLLIYDCSGWMSVQIVSDPKPTVPTSDSREAALAAATSEKATAFDGYYAYFGTWSVDRTRSIVTHHINESLYPAERGEEGVRQVELKG